MANGKISVDEALESEEKFRLYVVFGIEELTDWKKRHEQLHANWIKIAVGTPAFLIALGLLIKFVVLSAVAAP